MARRPGFTRKSLTCIAPASRRRVRRVSVTSRARGRLAAGLVFSAPATLCTHSKYSSTGRRANGRTGSGYENRRRGVECGPMAGTAATRRRGRGGCARGGPRFGSGEARRGRDGRHPIAAAPGRPSGPGFAAGAGVSCSRDRRHETRARPVCESEQLKRCSCKSGRAPPVLQGPKLGAGVGQRGWGPHAGVGRVSLRAVFVAAAGKVLFTGSPSRDARALSSRKRATETVALGLIRARN